MKHNITSNRLTDYVEFSTPSTVPNDEGEPIILDTVVFDAYCDIDVKSGGQLEGYGVPLTESIITALTWFNEDVVSDQVMLWNGDRYDIQHIQPDKQRKSMIVTGKFIGKQIFTEE